MLMIFLLDLSEYHYSRKYIIRGFNLQAKEISRFLSLKLNKVTRKKQNSQVIAHVRVYVIASSMLELCNVTRRSMYFVSQKYA